MVTIKDMKIHVNNTEDFVPWHKAKVLSYEVFKIFDNKKDSLLEKEILKSSIRIMNGLGTAVYYYDKRKSTDMYIQRTIEACAEIKNLLQLSKDFQKVDKETAEYLIQLTEEVLQAIKNHSQILN